MSHRISADADSRSGAELFYAGESRLFSGDERGGTAAFRGAKIDELVQIVVSSRQAQDRPGYQDVADGPDRQPIRFSAGVNVVYRCSPSGALLVLHNEGGFARDIFFQVRHQRASLQVAVPTRRASRAESSASSLDKSCRAQANPGAAMAWINRTTATNPRDERLFFAGIELSLLTLKIINRRMGIFS